MLVTRLNQRISVLVQITRIDNSFFAAAYTLVGVYLGGGLAALGTPRAPAAAVVVGLIVACGFVINDCYDLGVDALAKPDRPLPAGELALATAQRFAGSLAAFALLIAWFIGPLLGLMAIANLALTLLYSHTLKHTLLLGNLAMATLNASIVLFGSLAAGAVSREAALVALMMFWFFVAQEILYALEDIEGDSRAGARTTAVRLGRQGAVDLYSLATLAFAGTALLPLRLADAGQAYLIAITLCSVGPALAVMLAVRANPTERMVFVAGRLLKGLWLLGLIPVLILR